MRDGKRGKVVGMKFILSEYSSIVIEDPCFSNDVLLGGVCNSKGRVEEVELGKGKVIPRSRRGHDKVRVRSGK